MVEILEMKPNYVIKSSSVGTWHSRELLSGASVLYLGCYSIRAKKCA